MTTLAIYSNKGGVGKTATAVNIAYLAARDGIKTLIVDFDPQSSATYYFRVKPKIKIPVKQFAKGKKDIAESIKGTDYENLDILPADFAQRNLDLVFDKFKHSKQRMKMILEGIGENYDLIILDCPPTINILAENIFHASDYILSPIIPTTLSLRAHEQLLDFLKKKKNKSGNFYIFFTLVDGRKKMHHEYMDQISEKFKRVMKNYIPYSSTVEKMGIERQPVAAFSSGSTAARAYKQLWFEMKESILKL